MKKGRSRRRKSRNSRRIATPQQKQAASTPSKAKAPTAQKAGTSQPTPADGFAQNTPFSVRDVIAIGGYVGALVAIIQNATGSLWVIGHIVDGYRAFYSSVWRSLGSFLPPWLRPFDAPQTYDALTLISIMAASLFGARRITRRGFVFDAVAGCLLTSLLQIVAIRILDRTPYDVVATTTVNIVILGACLGLAVAYATYPNLKKFAALRWSPLAVAFSTAVLMAMDSPTLFADTLMGTVPPEVADLGTLRHVLWTALVLTNLGGAVFFFYSMRGPRRPLLGYSVAIAAGVLAVAFAGGIIEKALEDADLIPPAGVATVGS